MGFSQNNAAATEGGQLKPQGDYEVIISSIEERETKNGAWGLNFRLTIRNDIAEQKYKNACLFYTIWKKKEPNNDDLAVNGYNFGQLMNVGKASGLQNGKNYEGLNDYCDDLVGKVCVAKLIHDTYNGVTREKVDTVKETTHHECNHVYKTKDSAAAQTYAKPQMTAFVSGQTPDISDAAESDDDYPF